MTLNILDPRLDTLEAGQNLVYVQEEPALEIALPQVFDQPSMPALQRGKLPQLESLIAKIHQNHSAHPEAGLGEDYQAVVNEFQPLFAWATACWDYLLSTEGCRFVPRLGEQRFGIRGDYRVVTDKDYSRIVHRHFRQLLLEYAEQPELESFSGWLRDRLWPSVLETYRRMDQPPDPRQRPLTAYSYLRCVPYEFLNAYHHALVHATINRLPARQKQALDVYFLQFHTESATAQAMGCAEAESAELLRQGLVKLLIDHRLVYCLLRQIERY